MKKLHLGFRSLTGYLFFIGTAWTSPALSQPIVKVWNWEDSLAVTQLVKRYLHHLEVREKGYLIVHFSTDMPDRMQGMTFRLDTAESSTYPIVKVVINARLNPKQRRLVLAHEMVHVIQILKGELIISEGQVAWKGRKYRYQWGAERYRAPWESEAHRIDNQLARWGREPLTTPLMASNPDRQPR